jgi:hypothetical protein
MAGSFKDFIVWKRAIELSIAIEMRSAGYSSSCWKSAA